MVDWRIAKTALSGVIQAPASKSHSVRALLYGAFAQGRSQIEGLLDSPDVSAMSRACQMLGARVEGGKIEGVAARPSTPVDVVDAGSSGLVLRFIAAVAALCPGYTLLTGDASIQERRPAQPLLDGLAQLGATAVSMRGNGRAPLAVRGPVRAGRLAIDGEDSQPVSALLTLAALLEGETEINVNRAGERPWVDLTLSWLERLGVRYEREGYERYWIKGGDAWTGFHYRVPGDFSSALFLVGAAIVTDSRLEITNLDFSDSQGDRKLISLLQSLGVPITIEQSRIVVEGRGDFQGAEIDLDPFIDALPILAVLGCYALGEMRLVNGAIARKKESDRIAAITTELRKMGADIVERPDGVVVRPSELRGAIVESHHDHRIAMALAVAGLGASSETVIRHAECIAKTYRDFDRVLEQCAVSC